MVLLISYVTHSQHKFMLMAIWGIICCDIILDSRVPIIISWRGTCTAAIISAFLAQWFSYMQKKRQAQPSPKRPWSLIEHHATYTFLFVFPVALFLTCAWAFIMDPQLNKTVHLWLAMGLAAFKMGDFMKYYRSFSSCNGVPLKKNGFNVTLAAVGFASYVFSVYPLMNSTGEEYNIW
ncbi:uncharacterized protein BYT42DRAFT_151226 [Radiomyces spectabilis]|uniref:uncharacterized protein n=1 Tax=Radiomyces spectabilis TaxID=64574 RepID=UPI00221E3997|nr:uncharacterized protein BYT42DRAFT_151226 [Radiomyces spectabilis]KAI8366029.1 hypothetical protein BYT42DRAFT_151226 [Radiomyces spectabilis]